MADGMYIGSKFDSKSNRLLEALSRKCRGILHHGTLIEPDDIHMTIVYSDTPRDPDEANFILDNKWKARITGFDVFGPEGDVFVARIDCPEAVRLNNELMECGATTTYPDYKPHITLLYNVDREECEELKKELNELLKGKELCIGKVYVNELVENWGEKYENEENAATKEFFSRKLKKWKHYVLRGLKMEDDGTLKPKMEMLAEESRLQQVRERIEARLNTF